MTRSTFPESVPSSMKAATEALSGTASPNEMVLLASAQHIEMIKLSGGQQKGPAAGSL